jgi:rhodanese-related sulfurtransferase
MNDLNKDHTSEKQIWRFLIGALACVLALSFGAAAIAAKHTRLDLFTYLTSRTHPTVTVKDLQQGKLKPLVLIDVRSPEEHAADHIAGSILVPIDEIESGNGVQQIQAIINQKSLPNQPKPTVVLYCKTGPRSHRAYARLHQLSDFNFVVLAGGITAWREVIVPDADAKVLNL